MPPHPTEYEIVVFKILNEMRVLEQDHRKKRDERNAQLLFYESLVMHVGMETRNLPAEDFSPSILQSTLSHHSLVRHRSSSTSQSTFPVTSSSSRRRNTSEAPEVAIDQSLELFLDRLSRPSEFELRQLKIQEEAIDLQKKDLELRRMQEIIRSKEALERLKLQQLREDSRRGRKRNYCFEDEEQEDNEDKEER